MRIAATAEADIVNDEKEIHAEVAEIQRRQSPPGTYEFVSPLLERRRIEHVIPEGVFRFQAAYDRIYIYQLGEKDSKANETYGDTSIFMPQTARDYKRSETPRGLIVSAGLLAEEALWGHGMAVGHIVRFIRNAPWAMPVDNIRGKDKHVFVMRDGDITGSEDLMRNLKEGKCKRLLEWVEYKASNSETGELTTRRRPQFRYVNEDGSIWDPRMPWMPDDI